MPVNFLNLPGLDVVDFKETEVAYHVKTTPRVVSRLCPHCGRSHGAVAHARRTLVIRDIPSHGKAVVIHLDVPRLKCRPCNQTFTASVPEVDTSRECIEAVARPIRLNSAKVTVTVGTSSGVAHIVDTEANIEAMLKAADTALYAAKSTGKNRVEAYKAGRTASADFPLHP